MVLALQPLSAHPGCPGIHERAVDMEMASSSGVTLPEVDQGLLEGIGQRSIDSDSRTLRVGHKTADPVDVSRSSGSVGREVS